MQLRKATRFALRLIVRHPEALLRLLLPFYGFNRGAIEAKRGFYARLYFLALFEAGDLERINRETDFTPSRDALINRFIGNGLLKAGKAEKARIYLEAWRTADPENYLPYRLLGRSFVLAGDDAAASELFRKSALLAPNSVMAYQNSAARYDRASYRPEVWELEQAGTLLACDTLAQQMEDAQQAGEAQAAVEYGRAFIVRQAKLPQDLPAALKSRLAQTFPSYRPDLPDRILSYEWVTQIGHLGMLDAHAKLRRLGWLPEANAILLAPPEKVANAAYLTYFRDLFFIVREKNFVDALFPYQRALGDNFTVTRVLDGAVEPWTLAAARGQVEWCRQNRPALLSLGEDDRAFGETILRQMEVPEGAMMVGLHVREGGFYGEGANTGGAHRNADIADYLTSIKEITRRGGWVIRLGDRSMRRLPVLRGVIDYAHSPYKSARMDIFLLAACRMIIGTTSGLTSAAQSFGTPMLLVNCLSPDWQFWNDKTHFTVKRVYDKKGQRYLSLAETYRPPVQGLLISLSQLARHGYEVHANTAEDILDGVRDTLDTLEGRNENDADLIRAYQAAISGNPYIFGAAIPAASFLRSHSDLLQ